MGLMDKTAMLAKAAKLASSGHYNDISLEFKQKMLETEAALTAVWDEAIEAAANLVDVIPLLPPGVDTAEAIRRLRKGKT